jgi:hypothetical protein
VVGSLIVAVVGSATVPAVVNNTRFWTHEYHICGIAGLIVAVIALLFLRELAPSLRDQLMVTLRDRVLVEARAKGLDIEAALRQPFRQLIKPDVVISATAVSLMLLVYYTSVGFFVIYAQTIFGFSTKDANGLGNWNWGFNVIAVIAIGVISDRFRVRKPFMVIGGVGAAVMMVIYLSQAGHHPGYYHLAIILALLSLFLGIAYTPWMASFTETVEARNPALTATGLAIWGWIIRIVIFVAFLIIPVVVNSVTPLVNYGGEVQTLAAKYAAPLAFNASHPGIVATAKKVPPSVLAIARTDSTQLASAQKFAPELAVIAANPALFTQLATYPNAAAIPPAVLGKAIAAAGGGAKGIGILTTINANKAAIDGVIAVGPQLQQVAPYAADLVKIAPYSAQLTALAAIPKADDAFLAAHAAAVQKAAAQSPGQWKNWYWICFGGIIFFLLSIPRRQARRTGARGDGRSRAGQAERPGGQHGLRESWFQQA